MTLDQAAIFFVGSILFMLGLIVITAGIVVMNNIFSRYWRTVHFFWPIQDYHEYRQLALSEEEKQNERTKQSSGPKKDRAGHAGNQQQPNQG
jgi:hypothetical protein